MSGPHLSQGARSGAAEPGHLEVARWTPPEPNEFRRCKRHLSQGARSGAAEPGHLEVARWTPPEMPGRSSPLAGDEVDPTHRSWQAA
ncbi:hypothetical protein V6N11_048666 [Hibiscus sabdariffa]|uniref:Uncharacterized protein n=1 Tax=Hibiscus sabdariffa TaxID=183260 RepID=A0ABR2PVY1_9ROSI